MPELPEVETTRARIESAAVGKRIRAVHVERASTLQAQRPGDFAAVVTGRRIAGVRRRGKNLLIDLSWGKTIRIHLRMTGELFVARDPEITPGVRVWFELTGGEALVFRDPRALGKVYAAATADIDAQLAGMGPEPLTNGFRLRPFVEAARASRLPAKLYLMDQKRVAGMGNLYAAEVLWRARIDPRKPMREISVERLGALYKVIRAVLREAIESATLSYKRPGRYAEGEFKRKVYAREGEACARCGRRIRRIVQGGRSTYFCPKCQT